MWCVCAMLGTHWPMYSLTRMGFGKSHKVSTYSKVLGVQCWKLIPAHLITCIKECMVESSLYHNRHENMLKVLNLQDHMISTA